MSCVLRRSGSINLSAVVSGEVLERSRNLHTVFGESGIGRIPYALDRIGTKLIDGMGVGTLWAAVSPSPKGLGGGPGR